MFFILDENIPENFASVIRDIFDPDNTVKSVSELGLRGVCDTELFEKLRKIVGKEKCIFITGDCMITKRRPEIESLKRNNFIGFFFPPSFSQKGLAERAIYLINAWRSLCNVAQFSKEKDCYILPTKNFSVTENEIKRKKYK